MTEDVERRVLDFWFGEEGSPSFGVRREKWFRADPEFDAAVVANFTADFDAAEAGEYAWLRETPRGSLALVLLLDQFPRNMFRGTARAFATDAKARAIARAAIERGFDQSLPPVLRSFFYLPFEHSEDPDDQALSVVLFEALGDAEWLKHAVQHRDVIKRFGRFPHRNETLGRADTPEETAFLTRPGSRFGNQTPKSK
jgi:uncharacterized protein (DUF924 family)